MKSNGHSTLASLLNSFFTDYVPRQRSLSPHTLHSYRDALKLLLLFVAGTRRDPTELTLAEINAQRVTTFLAHLETRRRNGAETLNVRLNAIHSFFRLVALQYPEHLSQAQRILSVPFKRRAIREVVCKFGALVGGIEGSETILGVPFVGARRTRPGSRAEPETLSTNAWLDKVSG